MTDSPPHAIVVGGSLAGACAALALARAGWSVTVLERSRADPAGMGIGIDRRLLSSVTGVVASDLPVREAGFQMPVTGWSMVWSLLADAIASTPAIDFRRGVAVAEVVTDRRGTGVRTDRESLPADLVIGADGYKSIARRFVAPEHPDAEFSGFVLWRGMFDETEIAAGLGSRDLHFQQHSGDGGLLVTFGIPGADGDLRPGRRRIVVNWFDATMADYLRSASVLVGSAITTSLRGDRLPDAVTEGLLGRAAAWPAPWRQPIDRILRSGDFIGTPIAEYLPTRLVRDGVALVGDAAHAVGPVTGEGFYNGLLDIQALIAALGATDDIPAALQAFENERLDAGRALVTQSRQWARTFLAGAKRR